MYLRQNRSALCRRRLKFLCVLLDVMMGADFDNQCQTSDQLYVMEKASSTG